MMGFELLDSADRVGNKVVTDQEGPVKFINIHYLNLVWTERWYPVTEASIPSVSTVKCQQKWLASKKSSSANRLISLRTSLLEMAKTRQNSWQLLLCKATSWTYQRMYVPSLKSVISRVEARDSVTVLIVVHTVDAELERWDVNKYCDAFKLEVQVM